MRKMDGLLHSMVFCLVLGSDVLGPIVSVSMQRFIEKKKINSFRRLLSRSASVLTSGTMIKSNIDPEKAISGEGYIYTSKQYDL